MARVLIAESNPYVLAGLVAVLEKEPGLKVVGALASTDEALERCDELAPNILVIDKGLGTGDSVAALAERCTSLGGVLVFLDQLREQEVHAYLEAGVYGFVSRQDPPETLITAIRAVARGEDVWLSPRVSNMLLPKDRRMQGSDLLSNRERQVLRMVAKGKSNREIAAELFLSEGTVRNVNSSIYQKLHVSGRGGAIAWAWKHGVIARDH